MNIKITVTIELPGSQMANSDEVRQEYETIQKNRQIPKGERKKLDLKHHTVEFVTLSDGKKEFSMPFFTRKYKPAKQVMNMGEEAYEEFLKYPMGFKAPEDYTNGATPNEKAINYWYGLAENKRLEFKLKRFARDMGGVLDSFHVYE